MKRLLVIDCAALGWDLVREHTLDVPGLLFRPMKTAFPALTCPAQAAFRTASPAARHGMVANGLFFRQLRRPMFWEQSSNQVQGPRIWSDFRARGGKVGVTFWQQSLGEDVDLVLSPRPIHKHSGGLMQDCYSQPEDLYARICSATGKKFNLMHYWGPLAGGKSSEWIASAVEALLGMTDAVPDLLLTYLPHLDYDLQRAGPNHPKAVKALRLLETLLRKLVTAAQRSGHEVLVFGDYAIRPTRGEAVLPNLALRQAGLMGVRPIQGMAYPDFWYGRAFAMVDHEVAHVYCRDPASINQARALLENLEGIDHVLDRDGQREWGIDHANSGDLVITALPGRWFAYPWWTERREAPDFAGHVDIHNKPGFDPCELFFGWPPGTVSQNTAKIGGSHGLLGEDGQVVWASTVDLGSPADLIALSAAVRDWL